MEAKQEERIIVLVDMDCFYVQVEQKLCPEYLNKPCAVVQYNTWKGGGIIAVNYEARARGVSKSGRGVKALEICPDIHLFRVPEVRGKADLTRYREAGAKVMEVLCKFSDCVERASIDEAYIDLTEVVLSKVKDSFVTIDQIPNTFVVGYENGNDQKDALKDWLKSIYEEDHLYHDRMLAVAASIVEEMRAAVYSETGYRCSAGIAHNKMLSKLSCGLHKPNKQTVIPQSSIPILYDTLLINKVRNLGGKFGKEVAEKFGATTMGDLMKLSKSRFISTFGEKDGGWLYGLSRGIDTEPVTSRQLPKSIGCGKNFRGKSCLNTKEKVSHWIKQLASELEERLIKDQESNSRAAQLLTITIRIEKSVVSRSCPIMAYNADKIAHDAFLTIQKFNSSAPSSPDWSPAILSLAMSAGKFGDKIENTHDIQTYFAKSPMVKPILVGPTTSSNIDTLVDLIDSNADLDCTIQEKSSIQKDARITQLFKAKSSNSTESTCVFSSNYDLTNHYPKLDNSISTEMNQKGLNYSNVEEELKNRETKINSQSTNETSKKVKGFFARKLEEKMKSLNKKEINPNSSNNETFDSSIVNFLTESNLLTTPSTSTQSETEILDRNNCLNQGNEYSDLDPELTYQCDKCNQRIPIWEEVEHLDYHLALDLSKEPAKVTLINQNNRNLPTHTSGKTSKSSTRGKKRGTQSNLTNVSKRTVQKNTLDSFFR